MTDKPTTLKETRNKIADILGCLDTPEYTTNVIINLCQQSALNRIANELKPQTSADRFVANYDDETDTEFMLCKFCSNNEHDCLCAIKAEERIAELKRFANLEEKRDKKCQHGYFCIPCIWQSN